MKIRSVLMAGVLAGSAFVPAALIAPTSGAAGTTQLWVTNLYTYGAGNDFDYTICLDGTELASLTTTDIAGPITVATGSHEVELFNQLNANCSDKPTATRTVSIPDGAAATMALWWEGEGGAQVIAFPENMDCVQPGMGRVAFRNLSEHHSNQDLRATPPGGSSTVLVGDVAPGDGDSTDLAAGTYSDTQIDAAGTTDKIVDVGQSLLPISETEQQIVYTYGGTDGAVGAVIEVLPSSACAQPTTTTTTAPTTTVAPVAASPATAVPARPTYTG